MNARIEAATLHSEPQPWLPDVSCAAELTPVLAIRSCSHERVVYDALPQPSAARVGAISASTSVRPISNAVP